MSFFFTHIASRALGATLLVATACAGPDLMRAIAVPPLAKASVTSEINQFSPATERIFQASEKSLQQKSHQMLVATPSHIDFGEVVPGAELKATVSITNVCDYPIKIYRINTTCSCTAGAISEKFIAPGSSVSLAISFQAPKQAGRTSLQRITVIPDIRNGLPVVIQIGGTTRDVIGVELVSIKEEAGAL